MQRTPTDAGECMSGVDMLRGKGAFGDAAVYLADEEPAASDGHVSEKVDGGTMGSDVSFRVSNQDLKLTMDE
jgi:hypothetical protein